MMMMKSISMMAILVISTCGDDEDRDDDDDDRSEGDVNLRGNKGWAWGRQSVFTFIFDCLPFEQGRGEGSEKYSFMKPEDVIFYEVGEEDNRMCS